MRDATGRGGGVQAAGAAFRDPTQTVPTTHVVSLRGLPYARGGAVGRPPQKEPRRHALQERPGDAKDAKRAKRRRAGLSCCPQGHGTASMRLATTAPHPARRRAAQDGGALTLSKLLYAGCVHAGVMQVRAFVQSH